MFKLTVLHYFLVEKRKKQKVIREREKSVWQPFCFCLDMGLVPTCHHTLYSFVQLGLGDEEVKRSKPYMLSSFPSYLFYPLNLMLYSAATINHDLWTNHILSCHKSQLKDFNLSQKPSTKPIKPTPTHWSYSLIFMLFICFNYGEEVKETDLGEY